MKVFRGGGLELHFIDETFSAERILIQGDTSRLSWAKGKVFGLPAGNCFLIEKDYSAPACFRAKFLYFSDLTATVTVDECDGAVRFSYLFRNEGKKEVSVEAGDLGVYFPFNDAFDTPSVTLRRRVHSFIRTDGSAYIYNARVSGESDAVSLIMTKGRCFSHRTQLRAFGVDKGDISLDLPALTLAPAESYEWEFLLFVHRDETDFFERARKYGFLTAEAERLVGYEGDVLTIRSDKAKVLSLGEQGEILFADGNVSYTLIGRGECALTIKDGENTRVLRCFTISRDIIDRRVDHLLQVRQISDGVGKGAFAAYDISTGTTVFPRRLDLVETTTMPLLFLLSEVARGRSAVRPAVDEALAFYDRETDVRSAVKNGKASVEACSRYAAVKYESYLYRGDVVDLMESASVLSTLFGETYACVPTCACRLIESLRKEGKGAVADELIEKMVAAADRIIEKGNVCDEKVFSPLAVSGALFLLSDVYLLTGKEYYLVNAGAHLPRVRAFLAASCDYRTNGMPTLLAKDAAGLLCEMSPTTDAAFFAIALERFARASGENVYKDEARNILLALLTLFTKDGSAHCGTPLPVSVNDTTPISDISWGEDVILYFINLLFERK